MITEAWLITGGLNKGVDQLIGNEVKERLANWNKIPKVVLGITNRECIAKKKDIPNVKYSIFLIAVIVAKRQITK